MTGYLHREDSLAAARLPEDDAKLTFEYYVWIEWDSRWQLMGIVNTLVHFFDVKSATIYRITLFKGFE